MGFETYGLFLGDTVWSSEQSHEYSSPGPPNVFHRIWYCSEIMWIHIDVGAVYSLKSECRALDLAKS